MKPAKKVTGGLIENIFNSSFYLNNCSKTCLLTHSAYINNALIGTL